MTCTMILPPVNCYLSLTQSCYSHPACIAFGGLESNAVFLLYDIRRYSPAHKLPISKSGERNKPISASPYTMTAGWRWVLTLVIKMAFIPCVCAETVRGTTERSTTRTFLQPYILGGLRKKIQCGWRSRLPSTQGQQRLLCLEASLTESPQNL